MEQVLSMWSTRCRPPGRPAISPLRALVFDCRYDAYKGVIAYVRVVDGELGGQPRCWP